MQSSNYYQQIPHQKYMMQPPQAQNPVSVGGGEDDDSDGSGIPEKKSGRRKIKIEYITDKSRRHITFSKRKAGIMKKAYELSTLTGTQVLLLVVSETGLVYTFTTPKLQPLVTKPEGKNLIQSCLNAPDPIDPIPTHPQGTRLSTNNAPTSPQTTNNASYYRSDQNLNSNNSDNNNYLDEKKNFGNLVPTNTSMILNNPTESQFPQSYNTMTYPTYGTSTSSTTNSTQSTVSGGGPLYPYNLQSQPENDSRYWNNTTTNKLQSNSKR